MKKPQADSRDEFVDIDPDILDWFKSKGKRYQSRINAVLRAYVEAHKGN